MTLLFCLAAIIVAAQVIGRAISEDTAAREQVVYDACVHPGGGSRGRH
jgi:hypothetical protein